MEVIRELLKKYRDRVDCGRSSEEDVEYKQLTEHHDQPYTCNRCRNPAYDATSRCRLALKVLVGILVAVVWTIFVVLFLVHKPSDEHMPKSFIDQCKQAIASLKSSK